MWISLQSAWSDIPDYIWVYLCIFLIAVPGVGTWYYKNHRRRRNTFFT